MTKLCARDGSVLLNVTVTDCPAFAVSVASSNLSCPFVTPTARVVLAAVPVDVLTPVAPGLPPPVLVLPPQAVRANNPPRTRMVERLRRSLVMEDASSRENWPLIADSAV